MFLLDAEHLSQSLLLLSIAVGLSAFSVGIISESIIEKELEIDGINEIALFVVGVGHTKKTGPGTQKNSEHSSTSLDGQEPSLQLANLRLLSRLVSQPFSRSRPDSVSVEPPREIDTFNAYLRREQ